MSVNLSLNAYDLVQLVESEIITKDEARAILGVPATKLPLQHQQLSQPQAAQQQSNAGAARNSERSK